ncbi:hypothetical protein [Caulobacter phage Kronos]|uniref:HNH endonuclease n=1 Tax=Caulobacter phage Kronos TaxID=2340873 RepID=A0A386KQN3_9CAUD|nr:hypothetical protein [Caulobacter phage Kronos]
MPPGCQKSDSSKWAERKNMPIKPENRALYPKDWKSLAYGLKEKHGWRCEGSPKYPTCRAQHGQPHPVTGSKVVLTIAHLDHDPRNSLDASNLKVWCQRCHLTYDAAHHAANAAATRARRGTQQRKTT